MSGLPFRCLLLLAAAAMSGVTAFTVSPSANAAETGLALPELRTTQVEVSSVAADIPFVARMGTPNELLVDRGIWARATRVVEPVRTSATLMFGGDILIHMGVRNRADLGDGTYDFKPMFDDIRPLVASADLAICHLEVPLTSSNEDLSTYPKFNAPHEVAEAIAYAGFDGCSTASNHSFDRGEAGLIDTLDILDAAGLKHAGTARNPEEGLAPTFYELEGLRIAHIAGTYWLNGQRLPEGKEWMAQRLDLEQILTMAGQAKWGGADLVVVSVHCCTEYQQAPTSEQVSTFEELSRSPWVDLVIGHHSHVVGPVDRVDEEFVFYGLGNFLSGQFHRPGTSEAFVAVAEAQWVDGKWRIVGVKAVPTIVEKGTYRVMPTGLETDSHTRTMQALTSRGIDIDQFELPSAGN